MDGCSNDCRYCYAKAQAIRFGRAASDTWKIERPKTGGSNKGFGKRSGTVMFPTAHDITEGNIGECLTVLSQLLRVGNKVLVVSKPRPDVIRKLCSGLETSAQYFQQDWRKQVLFRFTIGSMDQRTLRFWEPNAPTFAERLYSLMWAFEAKWQTSVSMEPMLDLDHGDAIKLARMVAPYVTDAVWIGKANKLGPRCAMNAGGSMDQHTAHMVRLLEESQDNAAIIRLHDRVMSDPELAPKVKWKESIKKVVGIETPAEIGLDI
jgi:hypothetical protein